MLWLYWGHAPHSLSSNSGGEKQSQGLCESGGREGLPWTFLGSQSHYGLWLTSNPETTWLLCWEVTGEMGTSYRYGKEAFWSPCVGDIIRTMPPFPTAKESFWLWMQWAWVGFPLLQATGLLGLKGLLPVWSMWIFKLLWSYSSGLAPSDGSQLPLLQCLPQLYPCCRCAARHSFLSWKGKSQGRVSILWSSCPPGLEVQVLSVVKYIRPVAVLQLI